MYNILSESLAVFIQMPQNGRYKTRRTSLKGLPKPSDLPRFVRMGRHFLYQT